MDAQTTKSELSGFLAVKPTLYIVGADNCCCAVPAAFLSYDNAVDYCEELGYDHSAIDEVHYFGEKPLSEAHSGTYLTLISVPEQGIAVYRAYESEKTAQQEWQRLFRNTLVLPQVPSVNIKDAPPEDEDA